MNMNDTYMGVLVTALLLAVIFMAPALAFAGNTKRTHRIVVAAFTTIAALHLLALPVIAVFGFMDGATQ
jgi:hypothetical protein